MRFPVRKVLFCVIGVCIAATICAQEQLETLLPTGVAAESSVVFPSETDQSPIIDQSKESSVFFVFIRMILVLAVVIVAIYFVIRLLKKVSKTPDSDSPYIRHISGISVAPGKTVHVVTIGNRGFLLGASESSLSLIAELDDRELIDSMNLQASIQTPAVKNFTDILSTMIPFGRKKIVSDAADQSVSTSSLSQQIDRLSRLRSASHNMPDQGAE